MTTPLLVKCILENVSGLPEDRMVTDWAFDAEDGDDTTIDGIFDSIVAFWNGGSDPQVADYVSGVITRTSGACGLAAYDLTGHLDGSPTGSPLRVRGWTMGARATGHTNYPSEVAVRMSLRASGWNDVPEIIVIDPGPPRVFTRPRARYRGGMYLGPWTGNVGESETAEPRPTSASFLAALDAAWFAFMDERPDFAVWSRSDAHLYVIAPDGDIRVDNSFDTQRRRGPAPTARTTLWP